MSTIEDALKPIAQKRFVARSLDEIGKAEKFQESLYDRFDSVELVKSPLFGVGVYVWEVSGER